MPMLPGVLFLIVASSAPRPVFHPDDPRARELRAAAAKRAEQRADASELRERWLEEDDLHFTLRSSLDGGLSLGDGVVIDRTAVDVAFGLLQRLASRYALQASVAIGTGVGSTGERGLADDVSPLFICSADVTLRIGAARVYFGVGPFGRIWRLFRADEPLHAEGGAVLELGFLFGEWRALDLLLRAHLGGTSRDGRFLATLSEGVAVAWHF